MRYELILRSDMPCGFVENSMVPELPAARKFLLTLEGRVFTNVDEIKQELAGFGDYLRTQGVPQGVDPDVRAGLFVFEDKKVGTYNDGMSDRCVFGWLHERTS